MNRTNQLKKEDRDRYRILNTLVSALFKTKPSNERICDVITSTKIITEEVQRIVILGWIFLDFVTNNYIHYQNIV